MQESAKVLASVLQKRLSLDVCVGCFILSFMRKSIIRDGFNILPYELGKFETVLFCLSVGPVKLKKSICLWMEVCYDESIDLS